MQRNRFALTDSSCMLLGFHVRLCVGAGGDARIMDGVAEFGLSVENLRLRRPLCTTQRIFRYGTEVT